MVDGWIKSKLGENLLSPPRYGVNAPAVEYSDQLPKYLRITDITDDGYFSSDNLSSVDHPQAHNYYLKKGEIVLARTGASVGKSYLYNPKDGKLVFAGFLIRFAPDESKLNSIFLSAYLQTPSYWQWVRIMSARSGQPGINGNEYCQLPLMIPSTTEQDKVAQIFNKIDEAIQQTQLMIGKQERIKKGLMQDLFTKGIDEKGNLRSEKTHKFKDSPLGRIPQGWDVKELQKLGNVIVSNVDKKTKKGEKPIKLCNYIDVYNHQYINLSIKFMEASASNAEIARFSLEVGNVLFTKDSETPDDIAVPAVVMDNIDDLICGYHLAIVKPFKDKITGIYLMKTLQLKRVNSHFARLASGATRYGLTLDAINTAIIPTPSDIKEQIRITNILLKIDSRIQKEENQLRKLNRLKTGLMNDLLTGKVRVNHLIEAAK